MKETHPLSVSAFLAQINALLETQVAWVEGEVTDVRISQGKWLHFGLKDAEALIHCFGMTFRIRTPLEDGMKVRVWGVPKVYPRYGKFSLVVELLEPAGEGALRRAFELLKRKLEAEGLFDPSRKRALPRVPEYVALLTSPDAAAYQDFVKVLAARWGGMTVDFVPVPVQGERAAETIARAIDWVNERERVPEVLILVRGGGSLEDLHAFNDELVVRALARSRIPTLVGVGHERDVTLADLVADVRASTPSNAAELLVPTRGEMDAACRDHARRLSQAVKNALDEREERVARNVLVLREVIEATVARVELLTRAMERVGMHLREHAQHALLGVTHAAERLRARLAKALQTADAALSGLERLLSSLHPQRVLTRGYSITRRRDGTVVRDHASVRLGDRLATKLARGTLESDVTVIHAERNE
ncbi:MAG: exodeoxyribonuclease VII large subunit [bacterium]|nr:exodeoxyribonuclease VII large subunit [bacterium]